MLSPLGSINFKWWVAVVWYKYDGLPLGTTENRGLYFFGGINGFNAGPDRSHQLERHIICHISKEKKILSIIAEGSYEEP